jgi:DNA mismatch repair protein MSH3
MKKRIATDSQQTTLSRFFGGPSPAKKVIAAPAAPIDIDQIDEDEKKGADKVAAPVAVPVAMTEAVAVAEAAVEEPRKRKEPSAEDPDGDSDDKPILRTVQPSKKAKKVAVDDGTLRSEFRKKLLAPPPSETTTAGSGGGGGGGASASAAGAIKYTPLEKQILAIRAKHPGVLLAVECGYKFRFYGEDAQVASSLLSIMKFTDHNFECASVPTQRLMLHLRRLVEAGHKVGLVKQTETSALKAAGNSKGLFARDMTDLYTSATMVTDDEFATMSASTGQQSVMCVYEHEGSTDERCVMSIACIALSAGEVVVDTFEDNTLRSALETRLLRLQPTEALHARGVTATTAKALANTCQRVEFIPARHFGGGGGEEEGNPAVVALKAHLKDFGLLHLVSASPPVPFGSTLHMALPGKTLSNLELLRNSDTGEVHGSLYWRLKRTKTAFGDRQLKEWISRPLAAAEAVRERQDALEELMRSPPAPCVTSLLAALPGLHDLERGLNRVLFGRCNPQDFCLLLASLLDAAGAIPPEETAADQVQSRLLRDSLRCSRETRAALRGFLDSLDRAAARENRRTELFRAHARPPKVVAALAGIEGVERELQDHLPELRAKLGIRDLEYKTVSQNEYLVEMTRAVANSKKIPSDWEVVSSTKDRVRYHTPTIARCLRRLAELKETLALACDEAWKKMLEDFSAHYGELKAFVRRVATFDCLQALASVSQEGGWVRPELLPEPAPGCPSVLEVVEGRHPIVEALVDAYVPNSLTLGGGGGGGEGAAPVSVILTGPNMGGKSCYIRQMACIVVLAQMGCNVPAQACRLTTFDAIMTRMGASDNLHLGHSTFFCETKETSDILAEATPRSLVILDELGRGTSTHDGTAIAYATLKHLALARCPTLFVTHYPAVGALERETGGLVQNYRMGSLEAGGTDVVFLYKAQRGLSDRSFGLNVARMAGLNDQVIARADEKGRELEQISNPPHRRAAEAGLF